MANENNQRGGSGNVANDPQKASETGKKGAQHAPPGSSGGTGQSKPEESGKSGQRGGSGNFANDPQRASEEGRKGGEHSHGGK